MSYIQWEAKSIWPNQVHGHQALYYTILWHIGVYLSMGKYILPQTVPVYWELYWLMLKANVE